MPIQKIKIIPSFPSGMARAVTGAGGRMLGQKLAIQEAGRNYRQERSLNQQADIANRRLGIAQEKLKATGASKSITDAAIKILNNKNSIIARQNVKRLDYGQEAIPLLRLSDVLREDFGIVSEEPAQPTQAQPTPQEQPMPMGGAANMMNMFRNAMISQIPQSNRGLKIRGFAEGGVVNGPEIAMVGEQGKEFIVPENKISPDMANQLQQIVGQGNQPGGAPTREGLAQLMAQIPNPTKIVSDKLPKVEQLMEQLSNYENEEDALNDLVDLDKQLMEVGMDLADVQGIEQFVQAYADKFGQEAAQKLVEDAVSRRGQ